MAAKLPTESRKKNFREMTLRMPDCPAFGGVLYSNVSGMYLGVGYSDVSVLF
jgi:hypothetical protein